MDPGKEYMTTTFGAHAARDEPMTWLDVCRDCKQEYGSESAVVLSPCRHRFHAACHTVLSCCSKCETKMDARIEGNACQIRCAIFRAGSSRLRILENVSLASTGADVLQLLGFDQRRVRKMTCRGSFQFHTHNTLLQYQVFPGEETIMWFFLLD